MLESIHFAFPVLIIIGALVFAIIMGRDEE